MVNLAKIHPELVDLFVWFYDVYDVDIVKLSGRDLSTIKKVPHLMCIDCTIIIFGVRKIL